MTKKQISARRGSRITRKLSRGRKSLSEVVSASVKMVESPKSVSTRMKSSHLSLSTHYMWAEEEVVVPQELKPLSESEFSTKYEIINRIGSGRTSVVVSARDRATGHIYACKRVNKEHISQPERALEEILILYSINHDNIVGLREVVESKSELILILEWAPGGDLYERLVKKRCSEAECKQIIFGLLRATEHLHQKGIIHRDIKPENILLNDHNSNHEYDVMLNVKLTDFGLAKVCNEVQFQASLSASGSAGPALARARAGSIEDSRVFSPSFATGRANQSFFDPGHGTSPSTKSTASTLSTSSSTSHDAMSLADDSFQPANGLSRARAYTSCGTDNYLAPEIIRGEGYGAQVDMWSIGVVLYTLLSGTSPFSRAGDDIPSMFTRILQGRLSFPEPHWASISAEAKGLVSQLLVVDPEKRLTSSQALGHQWFSRQL